MIQTIICARCGVRQVVAVGPGGASREVVCQNCGTSSSQDAQAAARLPTVLCIDDDPLVLHFYRDFLNGRGYRTLTVTDGLHGLAMAREARPDVILLDVMLRGLSGYDICRKFRADPALADIPIILITVWDHPSVAATGQRAGATLTLHKPADPETLVIVLAQVLGHPSGAAPNLEAPPGTCGTRDNLAHDAG